MTREEIIAKWDGMSERERDAWIARVIMGWHEVIISGIGYKGAGGHVIWKDSYGRETGYCSGNNTVVGKEPTFSPTQDIKHAMEAIASIPGELRLGRRGLKTFYALIGSSMERCSECGEDVFEVEAEGEGLCLLDALLYLLLDWGNTSTPN